MSARRLRAQRPVLVTRIHWWIYPVALVAILAMFFGAALGYLPYLFALLGVFLFIFWLSSLGFALYGTMRKPKEPRQ